MHEITDVESYNHYFGWYGGKTEDNGPWMDEYHEKYPNRCIGLSEYGCEGIITYQEGIQSVKIIVRHIRQDTTNIWHIC